MDAKLESVGHSVRMIWMYVVFGADGGMDANVRSELRNTDSSA